MKDIRIDDQGRQRCWNCGAMNFTHKRTVRSKVVGGTAVVMTGGLAAAAAPLATKKKLKCQACGEYNDVGSAKPYTGPASKRAAKKAGTAAIDAAGPAAVPARVVASERPAAPVPIAPPPPPALPAAPPPPQPKWRADPTGRHELRYWDGATWSDHVSDQGVQAVDPM